MGKQMHLRKAIWQQLDPAAYEGLSPTNRAVLAVILISSLVAIIQTEPTVEAMSPLGFVYSERVVGVIFLLEYLLRLWAEGRGSSI
jgi:voltage-gated potassium channel